MLVLTRKTGEKIIINEDTVITVLKVDPRTDQVKIGIDAPRDVTVHREEVHKRIQNGVPRNA